jgi:rsbT co-antagonist protein RsbR
MMSHHDELDDPKLAELYSSIADILIALFDVGNGDSTVRVQSDMPTSHPLGALCVGVNEMIAALATERERSAAYQRELEERLATIAQQRMAIKALSMPIIQVWSGVLGLPLIGEMDTTRTGETMEALLEQVVAVGAYGVVLDITGLSAMDQQTVHAFLQLARAVRLVGAECVIAGFSPDNARAAVSLDLELLGFTTFRTMCDAIRYFIQRKGARRKD